VKRLRMIVLGIVCLGLMTGLVTFIVNQRIARLDKGVLVQIIEVKYPEDVIVLSEKDLKQVKHEGIKWGLARALSWAKENSDTEEIASLEKLNKKFACQNVDLSLIKERDYFREEGIEGIDFVVDACLYGLIKVKGKEIKKISELWHIPSPEVISRLREKIMSQIASGEDILAGPLDIFEKPVKLEAFFKGQKILEEFYPPTTRIKIMACSPIFSKWRFSRWEITSSKKISKENPLWVNLFENRRIAVTFE